MKMTSTSSFPAAFRLLYHSISLGRGRPVLADQRGGHRLRQRRGAVGEVLRARISVDLLHAFLGDGGAGRCIQDHQIRDALDAVLAAQRAGESDALRVAVLHGQPRVLLVVPLELRLRAVRGHEDHLEVLARLVRVVELGQARREAAARAAPVRAEVQEDRLALQRSRVNVAILALQLLSNELRQPVAAYFGMECDVSQLLPCQGFRAPSRRTHLLGGAPVRQRAAVLQLLAGEDEALLIGRNAFFVLDLGLHVLDGVRRLHIERDGLARQGLHEDLHGSYGERT
eukprot:scaffold111_cov252-Pinguiococcus_pyrenoidosus.AAC.6